MSQWWSWILAAAGITGLWLAGRNNKVGWLVGLCAQLLWAAYGVSTRQWGFLVTAAGYSWVYAGNWRRWRRSEQKQFREGRHV